MDKPQYTPTQIKKLVSQMVILFDTREQSNYHIAEYLDNKPDGPILYKDHIFSCGDYSMMLPACPELGINEDEYFTDRIIIERKNSLMELSNNLGNERERFERELEKIKDATFIIMIEDGSYKNIVLGRYSKDKYARKSEFKPLSYVTTLASYRAKYGIHVDFVEKEYAGNFIYYILRGWLKCYLKGELYEQRMSL